MRVKIVPIMEVKCNFCLQWIQAPRNTITSLYICPLCLQRYQNGIIVLDAAGESHLLKFTLKESSQEHEFDTKCSLKSRIEAVSRQVSEKEKEMIESGISTNSNDNGIKSRNSFLMQATNQFYNPLIQKQLSKEKPKNRSQILEQRQNDDQFNEMLSKKRESLTNNFYSTLKKERKPYQYQFFFHSNEIDRYKEERNSSQVIQALFQTENHERSRQEDLFLELKANKRLTIKSHRSQPSYQSHQNNFKQREEIARQKIDAFLETRYQSTSLHRILAMNIKEAYDQTQLQGKNIELVSFNVSSIDLSCYLSLFDQEAVSTIKLINLGLKNEHVNTILDWLSGKKVERLVLTCNKLTDACIELFLNRSLPNLKQLYLGRNRINKYRMREEIVELRSRFIVYL